MRLEGKKIDRLLALAERRHPIHLLEIGTGSGGIAHWLAHYPQLHADIVAHSSGKWCGTRGWGLFRRSLGSDVDV